MEGENNNTMGQNMNMGGGSQPVGNMGSEKKSGSLLWSIIAIIIVVLLGYLLVKNGSNTDTTLDNEADTTVQSDNIGTQSNSTDINSIEADLESTNLDSLDVEIE